MRICTTQAGLKPAGRPLAEDLATVSEARHIAVPTASPLRERSAFFLPR